MSPLPERRKSPEELAALRESLGITADGPPPDAPGVTKATPESADIDGLKSAVFEKPVPRASAVSPEPETREERPLEPEIEQTDDGIARINPHAGVHSLRKSKGLVVDQPKAVKERGSGEIPFRRHTDEELHQLRKMEAPPVEAPAQLVTRRMVSWQVATLFYLLGGLSIGAALLEKLWLTQTPTVMLPFEWLRALMEQDWREGLIFGLVAGPAVLMLIAAGWIALARPLSRHHAGFLTLIAVLVLSFGILYFFPGLDGA